MTITLLPIFGASSLKPDSLIAFEGQTDAHFPQPLHKYFLYR